MITRRTALAALGASASLARTAWPQQSAPSPFAATPPPPAGIPLICMYSQNIAKVDYPEVGGIAQQIGYDGVDLTVREGGHVSPRMLNVDLVRAIEAVQGVGLALPMITTSINSAGDPSAYPILAITGRTITHMYRLGQFPYGTGDVPRRLAQIRNDLISLVFLSQRCEMTALVSNRSGGNFGESIWDTYSVINELDPKWIGYCYDPAHAVASGGTGWEVGFRLALPRIKAVAIQDFVWTKSGNQWHMEMCPLGEGMMDWDRFFGLLAAAKFSGPMTVHYEYHATDELGAMKKDLDFLRKQVARYWPAAPSRT